jgi:DNA-binding transcriptional LysR family regulator
VRTRAFPKREADLLDRHAVRGVNGYTRVRLPALDMSRKFDLTSLQLFIAVCEAKSISRAAEIENIAASAISKRIAQLEALAGVPLLIRRRSGVTPTTAGITLLEHARNVIYSLDLIERDLSRTARNLRAYIRIFASASPIAEFVPESVVAFLKNPRNRDIDIQIEEMTSQEVIAGVRDGLAVLGICWTEAESTGLEWIPYSHDHLCVVVPSDHPLASRRQLRFADTLDYEYVTLRPGSAVTALLRRESVRVGKLIRFRALVSTFEAAIGVVSAGLVIGIAPAEIASGYVSSRGIRVIPLTDPWAYRQFHICCRSRRNLPRPAAQFLAHLLARLKSG